jgi:hypothetical protein
MGTVQFKHGTASVLLAGGAVAIDADCCCDGMSLVLVNCSVPTAGSFTPGDAAGANSVNIAKLASASVTLASTTGNYECLEVCPITTDCDDLNAEFALDKIGECVWRLIYALCDNCVAARDQFIEARVVKDDSLSQYYWLVRIRVHIYYFDDGGLLASNDAVYLSDPLVYDTPHGLFTTYGSFSLTKIYDEKQYGDPSMACNFPATLTLNAVAATS